MDERFMENASALEQLHRDAAIAAATNRQVESSPLFDGVHCIEDDCGAEIPAARRALGKIRCIECQAMKESRRGVH
jgi:RNA polymerase-binding transcription factor DksA